MKRSILNIILVAAIIIVLVAVSLFVPRLLPTYKNSITAHEKSDTERFKYINATDTLNLYPWDTYDPEACDELQNPAVEGTSYQLGKLLLTHISDMFQEFYPQDEEAFTDNLYADSDNSGMLYVIKYGYINADNRNCTLNAAYKYGSLVYLCCRYDDQTQLTKQQISRAGEELTKTLKDISGWVYRNNSAYLLPGTDTEAQAASEITQITPDTTNPINSFFASYLQYLAHPPENDYKITQDRITLNLTDYSVIYYDHYYIISVDTSSYNEDAALYIFYDPAVEQVVGFSSQLSFPD